MKKKINACLLCLLCLYISSQTYCQKGQNEFEKSRVEGSLDDSNSLALKNSLKLDDEGIITQLKTSLGTLHVKPVKGAASDITALTNDITATITNIHDKNENSAVIVVYRDISINGSKSIIDFSSLKTLIYHTKGKSKEISNYLLETKKIFFVFIDMSDEFYAVSNAGGEDNSDKKLSNAIIKIIYRKSFFKQSAIDAGTVFQAGGAMGSKGASQNSMKLTLVEVEPDRVKAPCDVIASHKLIKEDLLTFSIHERNLASFQIGVENTKYALNNFAIANGNLTVKPDSTQKKNWTSNLYAVIEIHIPRDIDNFQPLWKDIFSKGRKRSARQYLYDGILSRIGIYGGLKVSKDPLSNLYSGVNFAITKELYINAGLTWTNEVIPQVTQIGNISSLSDALAYAKRKYSVGKFSFGLSFAPSAVIDMLGLKAKGK